MEEISICLLDSISTAGLDDQQLLYCPRISGESKSENHLVQEIHEDFDIDFHEKSYNLICKYLNDNKPMFEQIEKEFGYDIWLFHHERLKKSQFNFLVKVAFVESCLKRFPKAKFSIVVTNTFELSFFKGFNEHQFVVEQVRQNKKVSRFEKVKLLYFFMLNVLIYGVFKLKKKQEKGGVNEKVLVVHTKSSFRTSLDQVWHKLHHKYARLLLSSPPSFELEKESFVLSINEMSKLNVMFLSDRILLKALFRFNAVLRIRKVTNRIKNFYPEIDKSILDYELKRFHPSLGIIAFYKYAFSRFFKENNFETVLLTDENSPIPRAIRWSAENLDVKFFGYQHGLHSTTKPSYYFKGQNLSNPKLCHKTFVWSKFDYEWYQKAGYTKNELLVSGQIFGNIASAENSNSEIEYAFVYCTQPFPIVSSRKFYFDEVVSAFNKIVNSNNQKLLIRLHPAEVYDKEKYLEGIESYKLKNIEFDDNASIIESFKKSKSLITSFSTVSKEFSIYNRKIIALDYYNQDVIGIIKDGLALKANSSDSLKMAMEQIVLGDFVSDNKEYSDLHFFKNVDVIEFIDNSLNNG